MYTKSIHRNFCWHTSCRFSYLNDSYNIGETALQVMSINEDAEGKAGTSMTIYHLSYKPRTWEQKENKGWSIQRQISKEYLQKQSNTYRKLYSKFEFFIQIAASV